LYLTVTLYNLFLGLYHWFPEYEWWRAALPVPEAVAAGALLMLPAYLMRGGSDGSSGGAAGSSGSAGSSRGVAGSSGSVGGAAGSSGGVAGLRLRRPFFWLLAAAAVLLFLFSVGEAFFQHVYRRPFRIAPNLPLAVNFFNMLFDTELFSRRIFLLVPAAVLIGLLGLLWNLLLRGGAALVRRLSPAAALPAFAVLAALSLATVSGPLLTARLASQATEEQLAISEDRQLLGQAQRPAGDSGGNPVGDSGDNKAGNPAGGDEHTAAVSEYAFPGLEDADIHLFVVESYGMTIFTNPYHRRRLAEFYDEAARQLEQAGISVRSWGYESTVFGGTSWLADAALLSGLDIDTQSKYEQVIDAGTRNLLHLLKEAGYRRVLSAPGTSYMTDRYREFFDFSRFMMFEDFSYQGPYFTYGRMPDQYQLARVAEEVLAPAGSPADFPGGSSGSAAEHEAALLGGSEGGVGSAADGAEIAGGVEATEGAEAGGGSGSGEERTPLFVQYLLCSSHVPWNYIPPYLSEWKFPDSGRVYYDRSRNTYYENSWAAGSELFSGYDHSIRYSLKTVFGYIRRYLDDGELAIVIGDHQPKYPVSEKGASFAVPIHLLSAESSRLQPWQRFGFREGLRPPEEVEFPGIEEFLGHFLEVAEGRQLRIPEERVK